MDWQQTLSLGLVMIAAGYLVLTRFRASKRTGCSQGCACPKDLASPGQGSLPGPEELDPSRRNPYLVHKDALDRRGTL